MTLEQRLFLHRQIARLLEPVPPDVRLKLLEDFRAEIEGKETRQKYDDLIMSVERKFDGETRHQTAKRYIQEAESKSSGGPSREAPGTTQVTPEARKMLAQAARKKP